MSARPNQVNAGPPSAAQAASAPVVTSGTTAQGPHVSAAGGSRATSAGQTTKAAAAGTGAAGNRKRESVDLGALASWCCRGRVLCGGRSSGRSGQTRDKSREHQREKLFVTGVCTLSLATKIYRVLWVWVDACQGGLATLRARLNGSACASLSPLVLRQLGSGVVPEFLCKTVSSSAEIARNASGVCFHESHAI